MDILNEKIEGLVKKAEKSGMPYGILKKVYDRGMAAWKTGHRPGTTPQQWAFARVNSFITKSSGTWGKADKDLAKQVRGEEVERRKTASEMLGQVREARYEIEFTKGEVGQVIADRPGSLADYIQSELDGERIRAKVKSTGDEFKLEFNTSIPQRKMLKILNDKLDLTVFPEQNELSEKLPKDADAGDYVKDFRKSDAPQFKGKSDKKKQKMAIAAYLDSKEEVKEEPRQLKDPNKEAMVMKVKDSGSIMVIDKKDLKKYLSKGYIRVENNIKEENCPDCGEDPCKCKPLTEAVAQNDAFIVTGGPGDNAQKVIAVFKDKGNGLKDAKKARDEYDKKNNPTKPSHKARIYRQTRLSQSRNRLKPGEKIMYSTFGNKAQFTKLKEDIQESGHTDVPSMKTQVQIAMDALQKMNTELGKLSDEEELPTWWTNKVATAVGKLDGMADYIDAKHDQGQKMNEEINEQFVHTVRFEKEGMRFAVPFYDKQKAMDGKKVLQKSQGVSNLSVTKDLLKPGVKLAGEGKIVAESKMGEYFLDMQMDAQDMKERDFINKYKGEMGMNANELKRMYKEFNEEVEKVDNSLMAQATRVISHTSIREKIDPADIDVKATAADRKAADKNIIIQLRRAQDMEKQTGRADQSGIEFLDKKKQKVDPKIINKALDMFDKMKPNDKAKMQSTIGKSYRDLLKTVQRGRIWNTLTQKRTVLKKQSLRL